MNKLIIVDKHKDYMSSEKWNNNWSINNNVIFQKLIDFGISYYRQKILTVFKENKVRGANILELGCGTGNDTVWMMKNFNYKNATVVDFSEKALEKVKENSHSLPIKLINKDVFKLDLKEKFDLVHSGFVIEHFYGRDRENIIKKHAEFVKNNGFVFIQAPGRTFLSLLYSKTINKINGIDELLYTKTELEELCKRANLKIIKFVSLLGGAVFFILAKKD